MSLPGFIFVGSNIWEHFLIAVRSRPLYIPVINLPVPCIIAYIIGNVLTQYVYIKSNRQSI